VALYPGAGTTGLFTRCDASALHLQIQTITDDWDFLDFNPSGDLEIGTKFPWFAHASQQSGEELSPTGVRNP
jgi:hypothetical protein